MFVAPNKIDLIGDAALFLTFFDNPVVVTLVACIWFVYVLLVIWARRADKRDVNKVRHMSDCCGIFFSSSSLCIGNSDILREKYGYNKKDKFTCRRFN